MKCVEPTVFLLAYTSEFLFYWECNMHDHLLFMLVINVRIGLSEGNSFR